MIVLPDEKTLNNYATKLNVSIPWLNCLYINQKE